MPRELSNDALLHQLAAFLAYSQRRGAQSLYEWMDSKQFTDADRTFLEVAHMGATVAQQHRAS